MKSQRSVRLIFIPLAAVVAATSVVAQQALEFRIQQSGRVSGTPGCYISSDRVPIQIVVTNRSSERWEVVLIDHDEDGYPRPFPEGLQVRLVSASGNILTKHSNPPLDEEWWSSDWLRSTVCIGSCLHMAGDEITLAPGSTVRRIADLSSVIAGAPLLSRPLTPGQYHVTFRLGDLISNTFSFVIPESRSCDPEHAP
jgi:hypothetical protein